jgi:hypothetical protein
MKTGAPTIPQPGVLTTATLRARTAFRIPGTPCSEYPPSSSGSSPASAQRHDDVDRDQSGESFHADDIAAYGEVATFDESVTEVSGEVDIFKVVGVTGTAGEQYDAGAVGRAGGAFSQGVLESDEEGCQSFDGQLFEAGGH